jgi:hypothetical protein
LYATISKLVIILVSRVRTKKLLVKTPLVSFLLETCFVELNIKFFANDTEALLIKGNQQLISSLRREKS